MIKKVFLCSLLFTAAVITQSCEKEEEGSTCHCTINDNDGRSSDIDFPLTDNSCYDNMKSYQERGFDVHCTQN